MLFTAKYLIFYVLCVFSITHLSAQYTTTDFVATNLISDGLNAPGRMAIDADDNVYVTGAVQKNNQLFAGDIGTLNSYKAAQFI